METHGFAPKLGTKTSSPCNGQEREDKMSWKHSSSHQPLSPIMRLSSLPFSIDSFYPRPTPFKPIHVYFLTHAHRDHLNGLATSFPTSNAIYCTAATAAVAQMRTGAPRSCFKVLVIGMTTVVNVGNGDEEESVRVTPIDAKHCLGSCMFLIEGETFGRILHTGDFRWGDKDGRGSAEDVKVVNMVKGVDWLWVDCTYAHPRWKGEVWVDDSEVARWVCEKIDDDKVDVFIGSDGLGKEDLYAKIARTLGQKLVLEKKRWEIVSVADAEMAHKYFTSVSGGWYSMARNADVPSVRILPFWKVNEKLFEDWPLLTSREAVGVFPTGYSDRLRIKSKAVTVLPYSSHCTFSQLDAFIKAVGPVGLSATPETDGFQAKDGITRDPVLWFGNTIERYVKGDRLKLINVKNMKITSTQVPPDLDFITPKEWRQYRNELNFTKHGISVISELSCRVKRRIKRMVPRKRKRRRGSGNSEQILDIDKTTCERHARQVVGNRVHKPNQAPVEIIVLDDSANEGSDDDCSIGYSQPSYILGLKEIEQRTAAANSGGTPVDKPLVSAQERIWW